MPEVNVHSVLLLLELRNPLSHRCTAMPLICNLMQYVYLLLKRVVWIHCNAWLTILVTTLPLSSTPGAHLKCLVVSLGLRVCKMRNNSLSNISRNSSKILECFSRQILGSDAGMLVSWDSAVEVYLYLAALLFCASK